MTRPEELARGRRLRAALAAALVSYNAPETQLVRRWLDSWVGARDVLPARHRAPVVSGSAWEPTAWRAVRRAAWAAMER